MEDCVEKSVFSRCKKEKKEENADRSKKWYKVPGTKGEVGKIGAFCRKRKTGVLIIKKTGHVFLLALLLAGSQQASAAAPFSDIKTHWAKDQIEAAASQGWINGYDSNTFKPNVEITRAEFLKSLVVSMDYTLEVRDTPFKDDKGWSGAYITAGLKNSILKVEEYKHSLFEPNQKITRGEIAKMSLRALDQEKEGSTSGYLKVAQELNIMSGYPDGSLGGEKNATRAEAVVIISRVLAKQKGSDHVSYKSPSALNDMVRSLNGFKGKTAFSADLLLINVKGTDAADDNTISMQYNKELKMTTINIYASDAAEKALIKEMLKEYFPDSYESAYNFYVQAAEGQMKVSIDGRSFQITRTSIAIQINIGE